MQKRNALLWVWAPGKSLFQHGRVLADPLQILIVWRGIIVRNVRGPAGKPLLCSGVQPLVRFNVAVAKGHRSEATVKGGRVMDKNIRNHIHAEAGRADAGRVRVNKDKAVDRRVPGKL